LTATHANKLTTPQCNCQDLTQPSPVAGLPGRPWRGPLSRAAGNEDHLHKLTQSKMKKHPQNGIIRMNWRPCLS
jgi:hypothetical protein